MIHRLSEIVPALREACQENGWPARLGEQALLEVETSEAAYVLDAREHTGPIHWRSLEEWTARFGAEKRLILLTMGFFPVKTLGQLLARPDLTRRVALVEMGMRSFFDTEFRARKFGQLKTLLFQEVERILAGEGIELRAVTCAYCAENPLTACRECGRLICKSHFIPCPLCQARLCHPDVSDCYFRHEC